MLKNSMFVFMLLCGSLAYAAEPSPTPNPNPTPIIDGVVAVIDNKLVLVQEVLNPTVSITGAESSIDLGELVFLQAKTSNDLPAFVKSKSFKWTMDKPFHEDGLGGVFFGAGVKNTKIKAKVDVAETYQIGDQLVIKTSSQSIDVQIGSPTPNPPGPDPSPNPIPPAPTLTDNQKAMYDIALNTFGKTLSPDDFKKAAAILASDFSNCSQNITKGQYDSFEAFSNDLRATNQASVALLKLDLSKFDTFRTALHDWILAYYQKNGDPTNPLSPNGTGKIKILSDWTKIIDDMAVGLKAASN